LYLDKLLMRIKTLISAILLLCTIKIAVAQEDIGDILEGSIGDANTYLKNYMAPAFTGLGFGMNGGWYQTAKPHNTFGFDLTVSLIASKVPDVDRFFTFRNSDYTNFFYAQGNEVQVPTIFGPNETSTVLPQISVRDFTDQDNDGSFDEENLRFTAPGGLGLTEGELGEILPFNAVPVPMIQLGVGLIKNTDLKVRYIPTQNIEDDAQLSLLGFGLMHDITQWLPGEKIFPLSLSFFAGYTQLESEIYLNDDRTQSMTLKANSFLAQIVASKKFFLFLVPYVGLGYSTSNSNFGLLGTYETDVETLVDPISFEYRNSGFRTNIGLTLDFAIFNFNAEYAIQEYDTFSVGFGISIN